MRRHAINYQPKVAAKVCAEIAQGRSLREICEQPGFPSREAVRQWHARHEEFRREYDAARLLAVDLIADDLNELADSADDVVRAAAAAGVNENAAIQGLRIKIDTKKWLLSKLSPRYADRAAVELSGVGGRDLIPEVDTSKTALAILALLSAAKDKGLAPSGVRQQVIEGGYSAPAAAVAALPAPPAPPPAEPRRVFDSSSGQLVRTLLTGDDEPAADSLAAHAQRHIDHAERVVRLPSSYIRGNR